MSWEMTRCPRQDSNLRPRLRSAKAVVRRVGQVALEPRETLDTAEKPKQ